MDASGTRHELASLVASISESKKRKRTDLDDNATAALDILEDLHGQTVAMGAPSGGVSVSLSGFLHPMLARKILAALSYVSQGSFLPLPPNGSLMLDNSQSRDWRVDSKLDHEHRSAFACAAIADQTARGK